MASKNESSIYVPKSEIIVPEIYLTDLRKRKVFNDLLFSEADRKGRGVILITCSDGHVFPDLFKFLLNFFEFIHVIADNGGPFLLNISSRRELIIDSIKKAYEIKGFTDFFIFNHSFCAGAELFKFDTQKSVSATFDASAILEDRLSINEISVIPGYSINYHKFDDRYLGERERRIRTYKLSPQNFYSPAIGLY